MKIVETDIILKVEDADTSMIEEKRDFRIAQVLANLMNLLIENGTVSQNEIYAMIGKKE